MEQANQLAAASPNTHLPFPVGGQGLDISKAMLDVAAEREVEGDLCLHDLVRGAVSWWCLPLDGSADGAAWNGIPSCPFKIHACRCSIALPCSHTMPHCCRAMACPSGLAQ